MTNVTKDLAAMTPGEIDTELARLWAEGAKAEATIASLETYLARHGGTVGAHTVERTKARIEAAWTAYYATREEAAPFEAEFTRRGGWLRYFLVTNGNGHVHRGMDCHSCYPTTRYAWLIDLADCDETAMVEEWGEKACTVCFPDAPTNPNYYRPSRRDREAMEVRAAEKAAREAAKAEKAIFAPDGGPLRVPDGTYKNYRTGEIETSYETFKTKVAARNALSGAIKDYGWYGPDHPSMFGAKIPILVEALEAAGIDTAPVIARAKKAAAKEGARYVWNG